MLDARCKTTETVSIYLPCITSSIIIIYRIKHFLNILRNKCHGKIGEKKDDYWMERTSGVEFIKVPIPTNTQWLGIRTHNNTSNDHKNV